MWQTNLWDESLIGEPDVLDLLPKGALTLITHFLIISLHFVSSSRPLHLYFYLHCLLLEPQPHWHYPFFFFFLIYHASTSLRNVALGSIYDAIYDFQVIVRPGDRFATYIPNTLQK